MNAPEQAPAPTIPPRVHFDSREQPTGDELLFLAMRDLAHDNHQVDVVYSFRPRMNG
ncbi:hypothetical protein OHS33_39055 (plasmid) [Streptomyces sp. NBC_00536]|uniref:hypothetical protein n=1 Tax=Streptomyces sp. NBC_00536 TaxID=2975769 RepID=UPI002E80551B|nr:hypothetical protein [Streptomyces sp. NBC_00536]WUC84358.1 hypothetical protein OHS33_39055 [Streptomyces sp. NBC_00536]